METKGNDSELKRWTIFGNLNFLVLKSVTNILWNSLMYVFVYVMIT